MTPITQEMLQNVEIWIEETIEDTISGIFARHIQHHANDISGIRAFDMPKMMDQILDAYSWSMGEGEDDLLLKIYHKGGLIMSNCIHFEYSSLMLSAMDHGVNLRDLYIVSPIIKDGNNIYFVTKKPKEGFWAVEQFNLVVGKSLKVEDGLYDTLEDAMLRVLWETK